MLETDKFMVKNFYSSYKPAKEEKKEEKKAEAPKEEKKEPQYPTGGYKYIVENPKGKRMQLPREFDLMDNIRVDGEHLIQRTTMGQIFFSVISDLRQWVKMLAISIACIAIAVILIANGLLIPGTIMLILGFYYYGQYDIWIDRLEQGKQFAAVIPA
jgi:hypothetical protein